MSWAAATLGALLGYVLPIPLVWLVLLAGLIVWRWRGKKS